MMRSRSERRNTAWSICWRTTITSPASPWYCAGVQVCARCVMYCVCVSWYNQSTLLVMQVKEATETSDEGYTWLYSNSETLLTPQRMCRRVTVAVLCVCECICLLLR